MDVDTPPPGTAPAPVAAPIHDVGEKFGEKFEAMNPVCTIF